VGLVLGLVAVGLLVLSFFLIPREWAAVLWTALTVIGILVGISTFFLFGSQDEPSSRQVYRQARSTSVRPRPVDRSRPVTPKRVPPRPREDPYRELLARVLNDRGVADRLVEYKRKRTPHESFDELCRSAILRWQRDNR
jgi:hypothetical protein